MRLKDNTNPFIHVNPPYQLMVIHSSKLVYPRELYQRGVERKRVELIAAHFNEYVANEPKVSFRNGQFIVTDGQHTIEGRILRNGGKDLPILCKVYTGMTVEQEALLFAEQNGFSAPLTAGIKLRAKVVGGDAISKAFLAATNRVGLSLNYDSQQLTDYRIGCVGTAFRLYKQMGEPLYCETMRLIVAAWEGKPDSFRAPVLKGKFDILLVFMFDRIGRIADETPFVVEWFVRNGIRVWSTQEGEQRFDNHTDKLLNYIRFWQADGESEKTSVRTRTSLRQLVEEGHFKGGSAPYGYDLVKSGRINKRKHELYELHINEREAAVVRIIFDKYVHEGYGPQHIATYLNDNGYRARSGKCWHPASIRGMVRNLTYTGVLRCGDAHSELLQELQIIPAQQFEAAQRIRENRSNRAAQESEYRVPLNIHGQSLLSGNAYCGHCGAKLTLTSSRKWRKLSDGTLDDTLRVRYTCYGKLRKQTGCTGQTGYTVHILDEIIDKSVRQIFSKMRGIPKEQIITRRYEREVVERKNHLQTIQVERDKAQKDLISLKAEILACIKGESVFPKETLAEMITAQEEKLRELDALYESSYAETEKTAELMDNVSKLYEELISFSDLYDSASFEAKKMIVNQLIRRVDVYRGYQLNITFNFDLTPYIERDDAAAC